MGRAQAFSQPRQRCHTAKQMRAALFRASQRFHSSCHRNRSQLKVTMATRDAKYGAMTHDESTEHLLLQHVLQHAETGNAASVIEQVDKFCWEQRWMMHVGDQKGEVVDAALKKANPCTTVLEIGLYCGYSATRIASKLAPDAKLYSIEPEQKHREIASALLSKAGLSDKVVILPGTGAEVIPTLADKGLVFDFVFIDHEKAHYLPDLRLLEQYGLMRPGCVVVADNVVVFKLEDYLTHVRTSGKYSSSEAFVGKLEYVGEDGEEDGLEVSVYKG